MQAKRRLIQTSLLGFLGLLGAVTMVPSAEAADRTSDRGTWSLHSDRCAEPSADKRECFYHGDVDYPWRTKATTKTAAPPTTTNFDWREGLQVIFGLGDE